jgi:hypothetical protein
MGRRFWGSSFEDHVSRCAISNWLKLALGHHQNMTCFHVGLLRILRCSCMENPHWATSKRTTHLRFVKDMMYLCLRKIHSPNFEQLSPSNYLLVWMDLKYLFTFLLKSPISYHKVQAPCYRPKWRHPCLNVGPAKQTGSFFPWVISKTAWYDLGFYQPIVQKIIYLATKDSQYKNHLLELALGWKGPLQVQASLGFSLSRKNLG